MPMYYFSTDGYASVGSHGLNKVIADGWLSGRNTLL